jgi:hypothetical protein
MWMFWTVIAIIAVSLIIAALLRRKRYNFWPDLIGSILILSILWGLLQLTFVPAKAQALYDRYKIPATVSSFIESIKAVPPTPAPKASPTSTLSAPIETTYLKIPVDEAMQLDTTSYGIAATQTKGAQMIVVVKEIITTKDGNIQVKYRANEFCVEVVSFLKEDNTPTDTYDKDTTKSMLVVLDNQDLARYGSSAPNIEKVYFVRDPACVKFPTQTPTPAPVSTP